jgi:hypothetical protein
VVKCLSTWHPLFQVEVNGDNVIEMQNTSHGYRSQVEQFQRGIWIQQGSPVILSSESEIVATNGIDRGLLLGEHDLRRTHARKARRAKAVQGMGLRQLGRRV